MLHFSHMKRKLYNARHYKNTWQSEQKCQHYTTSLHMPDVTVFKYHLAQHTNICKHTHTCTYIYSLTCVCTLPYNIRRHKRIGRIPCYLLSSYFILWTKLQFSFCHSLRDYYNKCEIITNYYYARLLLLQKYARLLQQMFKSSGSWRFTICSL